MAAVTKVVATAAAAMEVAAVVDMAVARATSEVAVVEEVMEVATTRVVSFTAM